MKSLADTLFGRALGRLADVVCRHRRWFLYPQIVLFILCVAYTALRLEFDASRDNLVGSGKQYHQNFLKFKKEFPTQDDLVVVIESENQEKNRQFVERLGARLEAETNIFTDVFYKGDLKMMGAKTLLFVPEGDLKDLRQTLADYLPAIQHFEQASNLSSLFRTINSQFLNAKREQNAENDTLIKALPMVGRIISEATASLLRPGTPPSPGIEALFSAGDEAQNQMYITFAKGRIYLATARARTEDLNDTAVDRLRTLVAQTQHEVPGLNVGVTGEPILEHDEMQQSQKDSTVASIVSLIVCALIFIYGYQETGRPLKATLCLIIGLGYTMAFTTLVVGHLNILTITFLPILIGLAIDFGVHLITRYEEELRHGRSEEAAMRTAIVFTGQGIFTGALTTAAAFLAMWLTDFKGIQEMGIICGGGMLICFIPMLTMLPVLLFRGRQNVLDHELALHEVEASGTTGGGARHEKKAPQAPAAGASTAGLDLRARIERLWLDRPVWVTALTIALSLIALTQFHKVYFDYNLLNMQSKGLPAVVFEKKLIDSAESVLFAAVVADTPQQAIELEKRLAKLPSVSTNISMAGFLTEDATEKLKLIGQIKEAVAPVNFRPPDPAPVNLAELSRTLYSTAGYFGAAADEVAREEAENPKPVLKEPLQKGDAPPKPEPSLSKDLLALRATVNALRKQMLGMDPAVASEKLAAFQRALFNDVRNTFEALRNQDNSSPLRVQDLPSALRNRFIGVTGKYLIQVYPRENVWEREKQKEFVLQVQSVSREATGTPVQLYYYTELLKQSYEQAAWYALGAIILMVLVHFRTISSVVLAILPVAIGSIWLGGLMGFFGIPFNPANIMTLPLVIGIGVTNGIHILNRFAEEQNANFLSKSTGKAVFVSGLTTLSGFGSLILAKHQGIQSLGYVMATGVATCMIAALAFLPAVLNLMLKFRAKTKQPSGDNAQSPLGREEPR